MGGFHRHFSEPMQEMMAGMTGAWKGVTSGACVKAPRSRLDAGGNASIQSGKQSSFEGACVRNADPSIVFNQHHIDGHDVAAAHPPSGHGGYDALRSRCCARSLLKRIHSCIVCWSLLLACSG